MLEYTGERLVPGLKGLEHLEMEHRLRYEFALQFAGGARVLDLGSGEGYGAAMISAAARRVVGIERDAASVGHASAVYGSDALAFICADAARPPFKSGTFDLITCFELIEHVPNPGDIIAESARLLKPHGVFICSTPNAQRPTKELEGENIFHVTEYSLEEFRELCGRSFRHVSVFFQHDLIGGAIEGGETVEVWSGKELSAESAAFFVAVCSAAPWEKAFRGASILRPDDLSPRLNSLLRKHRVAVEGKNLQLGRLFENARRYRREIALRDENVRKLRRECAAARSEKERLAAELQRQAALVERWRVYAGELRRQKEELFTTKRWKIGTLISALLRVATFRRPQRLPVMETPPSPEEPAPAAAPPAAAPMPEEMGTGEAMRRRAEIVEFQKSMLTAREWPANSPLVSIVILNRDGETHLRRCMPAIARQTRYPCYEVIVVDNGSSDGSLRYLEEIKGTLPLRIIRNESNRSFAAANNQGIAEAKGSLILFLNNDTEPLEGWLGELAACLERHPRAAAVGAKLIYPWRPGLDNRGDAAERDFTVQHAGIRFRQEADLVRPYNAGKGLRPEDPLVNQEQRMPACTCACLLARREAIGKAGLFDTAYKYGFEDVDLCLSMGREGYEIWYCPSSAVFHHEFATQNVHGAEWKKQVRAENAAVFRGKWYRRLSSALWEEKLGGRRFLGEKALSIGITVTEDDPRTAYGDYFTATELGAELEKLGCRVSLHPLEGGEGGWYRLPPDLDVLIVLFHRYDIRELRSLPHVLKVAWVRNWVSEWIVSPWFGDYDIVLANSRAAAELIEREGKKKCELFYLATNPSRFAPGSPRPELACDYMFAGSYWDAPREITDALDVESGHRFGLYGKNWERHEKFSRHARGPLRYEELRDAYNSAAIVLDDSNYVTKPYGQLNSRVFDAIACGRPVITNNEIGSQELFGGFLPFYRTPKDLKARIRYFLDHPQEGLVLAGRLRAKVLAEHTYAHRAAQFMEILRAYRLRHHFCVKVGAPRWEGVESWGDYHMARALKSNLEREGHRVTIRILPEWDDPTDVRCDVAVHLRGLSSYRTKKYQFNIMWNISHPKNVPDDEYEKYDIVFVASERHARALSERLRVPVRPLLQCTDPEIFFPDPDNKLKHELLFVGNSRMVFRKILRDLIPTEHELAVYGDAWDGIIDRKYVRARYFPHEELRRLYSSAAILLNDHWDDMRDYGFVSNRIYDALAAGAFIISDHLPEIEKYFGNAVVTYSGREDLKTKIGHYLSHPDERRAVSERGRQIVLKEHTYLHRIRELLAVLPKADVAG